MIESETERDEDLRMFAASEARWIITDPSNADKDKGASILTLAEKIYNFVKG